MRAASWPFLTFFTVNASLKLIAPPCIGGLLIMYSSELEFVPTAIQHSQRPPGMKTKRESEFKAVSEEFDLLGMASQ
jgi:hypothetical protein